MIWQILLVVCIVAVTFALIGAAYIISISRVRADHSLKRYELDCDREVAMKTIEQQAKQPGDLVQATQICNHYGFAVLQPNAIPEAATRMGYVLHTQDQWESLLHSIRHRTNISGKVDDMLREGGFIPKRGPHEKDDH